MKTLRKQVYSYSFIIPAAILYVVLFIIPTFSSFYFSMTRWDLYESEFTGIENFILFFKESSLSIGLRNTLFFAVVTCGVKAVLGLLLALLLNSGLKTQGYLRAVFFFPAILSTVAVGLLFTSIMHPTTGLINQVLAKIGLGFIQPDWLGDTKLVMLSVSLVDIWKGVGIATVIYIAGLQSIPRQYYEAIGIDGGNSLQKFRYITLPLVKPAMNSVIILALIGGLRSFEIVYVMTKGGPGFASDILSTVIYKQFADGYYGLATAGNVLLFVLVSAIAFPLYLFINRNEVEY